MIRNRLLQLAFALLSLMLSGAAHAQTTYTIIGGPYADGYYPPYLYSFSIQLGGTGNSIGWVTGSTNHEWACGNGKPSQGGFIFYYINSVEQPCANSVTYTPSGTVTIDFTTPPYTCSGPAKAVETFDDNSSLTVFFTYAHGGRWHNICVGQVIAGSLTVQ